MSVYRTTTDLKKAVLKRCGELTDGTSSYDADVVEYLNSVQRSIVAGSSEFNIDCGEPWIWATATAPQLLTLKAPYSTGTATLTHASAVGAFSVAPTVSVAGWFLKLESTDDWYQVLTHVASSTAFTIDQAFIGSTATDSFQAIKTDYVLPTAACRLVAPMVVYHDNLSVYGAPDRGQIYEIDLNTMIRKFPRMTMMCGTPDKYAVVSHDTTDILTVRFNTYPAEDMRVEIPYIPFPADLTDSDVSIPIVPLAFRQLLAHGAAYFLMLDKSDNRSETEMGLAKAKLVALISYNRRSLSLAGSGYGKLTPRLGNQSRRYGRSEAGS